MDWKRFAFLLGVTASALYAMPQLQLSTTALGPLHLAPNANGPTQTVTANNIGTGTLSPSVTASASWLQPTVSGSSIQIALNTASLAPGTYTEFVVVSAPGAIDAPQNISVTIQISGTPASLTYYAAPGGAAVTQQIVTQGQASASTTTLSGSGWLSVSLSGQGSFTTYFPYNVTVTPQTGQGAGDYAGTVNFSGSPVVTDNKQVPVLLHLTSSPIQQFSPASAVLTSGGTTKATTTVTVTNAGQGALSLTGAQGSASWLTGTVSGTTVTVTADPSGLAAGIYQGTLTVNSNAANTTATTLPVELVVNATSAPVLSFGGVVDNATFAPTLSPGMISQAYGILLSSPTPALAGSLPLSTNFSSVQVSVNGIPAPIYYTSPGVIDFVVPFATQPGPATVILTYNGISSNAVSTTIVAQAPRILYFPLTVGGYSYRYAIATNASDGSFPIPVTAGLNSHPAKLGDTLTIYALGLGVTDKSVADGTASPTSPLANSPVSYITIGGGFYYPVQDGAITFAGLAPGFVGLYQINMRIPQDAPIGNTIAMELHQPNGISNQVYIAISN